MVRLGSGSAKELGVGEHLYRVRGGIREAVFAAEAAIRSVSEAPVGVDLERAVRGCGVADHRGRARVVEEHGARYRPPTGKAGEDVVADIEPAARAGKWAERKSRRVICTCRSNGANRERRCENSRNSSAL